MTQLLMPKATAVWLIDNTALSFDQIADLCSLHPLEVQSIADGETGIGIQGYDPVQNGQLTREEIERCEADPSGRLELATSDLPTPNRRTKGPRYVPVARRGDKPDGIAWLVKHHPELKDSQIVKLIGTTKETITKIRERTHTGTSATSRQSIRRCSACASRPTWTPPSKRPAARRMSRNRYRISANCPDPMARRVWPETADALPDAEGPAEREDNR